MKSATEILGNLKKCLVVVCVTEMFYAEISGDLKIPCTSVSQNCFKQKSHKISKIKNVVAVCLGNVLRRNLGRSQKRNLVVVCHRNVLCRNLGRSKQKSYSGVPQKYVLH